MNAQNFAKVYILDAPYGADRAYDYFVPVELLSAVKVGGFVVVPFGGGNRKRIGIVTEMSGESECEERLVKPVSSGCSPDLCLSAELLRLALYVKEHCLCTLGDVVHSMIPAAAFASLEEQYRATDDAKLSSRASKQTAEVFSFICDQGFVSESRLKSVFGAGYRAELEKLLKGKKIVREMRLRDSSKQLFDKRYSLTGEPFDESKIRSVSQRAVIELLKLSPDMDATQLKAETGASSATLKTLEEKGIICCSKIEKYRNPYETGSDGQRTENHLSDEQREVADELIKMSEDGAPHAALLHGVTGSGKTVVMTEVMDRVLDQGKSVILLLPEISLTPQTIGIFCRRYGRTVAVVHSGLSAGERLDAYKRIAKGDARIVIGTRSAVFSPVQNLGLIIMDEEQETTYKSDQNPKYHARDVARFRCAAENALLLLASATPSLESYHKAMSGAYTLLNLKKRFGGSELPRVKVCDMRSEPQSGNLSPIGGNLTAELNRVQSEGDQSVLFLNRRGYNKFVSCRSCGNAIRCTSCSVSMTYHTSDNTYQSGYLMCHICGRKISLPQNCPDCASDKLVRMGYGTQRVEQELSEIVPGARVLRMDTDTTTSKFSYDKILGDFRARRADILLGTQMVTKGHDFPGVKLVGVLLADSSLYLDDYRAGERTFSMLTQVIGRAGRSGGGGLAVIQTCNPDSDIIKLACAQDYETFYQREIKLRQQLKFPPFCDIALITVSSADEREMMSAAAAVRAEYLRLTKKGGRFEQVPTVVFGPFEAPIYRAEGRCRMRFVIKCKLNTDTRALFDALLKKFSMDRQTGAKTQISLDFNPTNL